MVICFLHVPHLKSRVHKKRRNAKKKKKFIKVFDKGNQIVTRHEEDFRTSGNFRKINFF